MATYILSQRLLPLLEKSKNPHIVNVASAGQLSIDFTDPLLKKSWSGVQSYCQAKLCQISLAFEMAEKHKNIRVNALHPASYMPTKIVTHMFSPQSEIKDGVKAVVKLATDEGSFWLGFSTKRNDALDEIPPQKGNYFRLIWYNGLKRPQIGAR
ncbi:MAG: hypothetical protein AAF694_23185 [Bacteroidota bacterium]